ncbi:MAG: PEP-CTERM sorting domain-containing protein [Akkermansiaceae bacterium]
MKKTITTLGLLAASAVMSQAAVSFTGTAISQTFDSYDGTAAPTGWDASGFSSGAGFSENRGSSTGGVGTGGAYAFDVGAGNVALGVQPGGSDFTPGYFELEVTNDSGSTVATWAIAFKSYVLNDQARGNSFNFSFSTDGSSYTPVAAGSFTSADGAGGSWTLGADYSDSISASVASGSSLFLRWSGDDESGSGSRDEFALDDVSIDVVPEPSSTALLGLGGLALLARRRR